MKLYYISLFLVLDISLPKSSRRETKVPLKYRMDGDYTADGKIYCPSNSAPSTTSQEILSHIKSVPKRENGYVHRNNLDIAYL